MEAEVRNIPDAAGPLAAVASLWGSEEPTLGKPATNGAVSSVCSHEPSLSKPSSQPPEATPAANRTAAVSSAAISSSTSDEPVLEPVFTGARARKSPEAIQTSAQASQTQAPLMTASAMPLGQPPTSMPRIRPQQPASSAAAHADPFVSPMQASMQAAAAAYHPHMQAVAASVVQHAHIDPFTPPPEASVQADSAAALRQSAPKVSFAPAMQAGSATSLPTFFHQEDRFLLSGAGQAGSANSLRQSGRTVFKDEPAATFMPAASFQGAIPGYVFKLDISGLGYYLDERAQHGKGTTAQQKKDKKEKKEHKKDKKDQKLQKVQSPFAMASLSAAGPATEAAPGAAMHISHPGAVRTCPRCNSDCTTLADACDVCGATLPQLSRVAMELGVIQSGEPRPPFPRQHIPRDLGRRMMGSTEDVSIDQMEFASSKEYEHIPLASEAEERMTNLVQLPPPEVRDLGPKYQWAKPNDLHPMAMHHLSMIDEQAAMEAAAAAAAAEAQAAALQMQQQQQLQQQARGPPPDPEWLLRAPQVAMDLKQPSHYWPHELHQAEFEDAHDAGRSQMLLASQEEESNHDRLPDMMPGYRVYTEERWNESHLIFPEGVSGEAQQQAIAYLKQVEAMQSNSMQEGMQQSMPSHAMPQLPMHSGQQMWQQQQAIQQQQQQHPVHGMHSQLQAAQQQAMLQANQAAAQQQAMLQANQAAMQAMQHSPQRAQQHVASHTMQQMAMQQHTMEQQMPHHMRQPVHKLAGGSSQGVPPSTASNLAMQLGGIISTLEGGEDEAAIDNLRLIHASYNAAINSQGGH